MSHFSQNRLWLYRGSELFWLLNLFQWFSWRIRFVGHGRECFLGQRPCGSLITDAGHSRYNDWQHSAKEKGVAHEKNLGRRSCSLRHCRHGGSVFRNR